MVVVAVAALVVEEVEVRSALGLGWAGLGWDGVAARVQVRPRPFLLSSFLFFCSLLLAPCWWWWWWWLYRLAVDRVSLDPVCAVCGVRFAVCVAWAARPVAARLGECNIQSLDAMQPI